jgi:hypothetical protein
MRETEAMPILKTVLVAILLGGSQLAQAVPPRVQVEYSPGQDTLCSLLPGSAIRDSWKTELLARQGEFVALWEAEGPRLLAAAERLSGRVFPAQEVTAQLTLCNTPSESSPGSGRVTVNMRFALASFTASPVSMRYKADTLFHEMLHILLAAQPVRNSVLLEQHASEPARVRNHLHLLALQKAVLLELKQPEVLKEVVAIDSQLPGGYYKRAWEIVNASDGEYLKYVGELAR